MSKKKRTLYITSSNNVYEVNESKRKPEMRRGYVTHYRPSHPRCNGHGYVKEHILVAERKLGRLVARGEYIHHVNGRKNDNDPKNLEVFPNQQAHFNAPHAHITRETCPTTTPTGE